MSSRFVTDWLMKTPHRHVTQVNRMLLAMPAEFVYHHVIFHLWEAYARCASSNSNYTISTPPRVALT